MSASNASAGRLPPDHAVRERAVNGRGSYIVQAPAGSGKTELLVQRYLRLLAEVKRPEAILAITFTNKAAAEMRGRILDALAAAQEGAPDEVHRLRTWQLARAAMERDAEEGWDLPAAPRRLRVQTIDSFCAELARQLPVLSGFGALPVPAEDAADLYQAAAQAVLEEIDAELLGDDVAALLEHLDGNASKLVRLIAHALARREQWLKYIVEAADTDRAAMEAMLGRLVAGGLARARALCPAELLGHMWQVLAQAASFRVQTHGEAGFLRPALALVDEDASAPAGELARWRMLADFVLLKNSAEVRSRVTRNEGVPGKGAVGDKNKAVAHKEAVLSVLEAVRTRPALVAALDEVRHLPEPYYCEQQWRIVGALWRVLRMAAAHLQLEFSSRFTVDFAEIQLRSLDALGRIDAPSDLMLGLDARVEHLLVDEFQDTSYSQMRLLERLCSGWQRGDGRSAFLVGDPMQSIYRFREAQVSLFLSAWRNGIGPLALEPLRLTANFRSSAPLVEWTGHAFATIFPAHDDAASGAVSFAPAIAQRSERAGDGVSVHPLVSAGARGGNDQAEAELTLALVQKTLADHPGETCAVLVRSRGHLAQLMPKLRQAGVSLQAVEVESLETRTVVLELYGLVRAVLHGADGPAWLTVLRAPWCGLELHDLHTLFTLPQGWAKALTEPLDDIGLPAPALARLRRVMVAVARARRERLRLGLASAIENAWYALGGPHCLASPTALEDARSLLALVAQHEHAGDLRDTGRFDRALAKLYSAPEVERDADVQLMTMHKAKGLEFDTVIVPGLGKQPRRTANPIVLHSERVQADGTVDLLVAPIAGVEAGDPLFEYLLRAERERDAYEVSRLLYVAVTRAKRRLHLLGQVNAKEDGSLATPPSTSLLHRLWPLVVGEFEAAPRQALAAADEVAPAPRLKRITGQWLELHTVAETEVYEGLEDGEEPPVEFNWAGENARHVGTVVHRWLERFGAEGLAHWTPAQVRACAQRFAAALANLGVPPADLPRTSARVCDALCGVVTDERARWILGAHREAYCEFAITQVHGGTAQEMVIDRMFIDEAGIRWVVDFKTGGHEGGDIQAFLDSEQARYAGQLERYAAALNALAPRPTRLGLYFPLLKEWREWSAGGCALGEPR
ncbi:MAG: AAA family ATPase [Gammaproteobacteria bacterium]|nr:AAA family ATPase [Gammaproteobacteria bacterium]